MFDVWILDYRDWKYHYVRWYDSQYHTRMVALCGKPPLVAGYGKGDEESKCAACAFRYKMRFTPQVQIDDPSPVKQQTETEKFRSWLQAVEKSAQEGKVVPGQLVTLQQTGHSAGDGFEVYFVISDPYHNFMSKKYCTRPGFGTYIPSGLAETDIEILTTGSDIGKHLQNKRLEDKFVVEQQGAVYRIASLATLPESRYFITAQAKAAQEQAEVDKEALQHDGANRTLLYSEAITTGVKADVGGWSDAEDATRNYGFMARDNGGYGSFPGHDDYSDESNP